jgi:hypothetical protein
VSEWAFFMHPPRDDFMATMTGAERSAFDAHAAWLRTLLADGVLIVAGRCLGQVNTGIAIFEAPDEQAARRLVAGEPVTSAPDGDIRRTTTLTTVLRGTSPHHARDAPQPCSGGWAVPRTGRFVWAEMTS